MGGGRAYGARLCQNCLLIRARGSVLDNISLVPSRTRPLRAWPAGAEHLHSWREFFDLVYGVIQLRS